MSNKSKRILKGEKIFAENILKVIPLIKKHFEQFDGEKVLLTSGNLSAKFEKLNTAFKEELNELIDVKGWRCFISNSAYSVRLCADISVSDGEGTCSVSYFGSDNYFANIGNDGHFLYKFDENEALEDAKKVLAVSEDELEEKKSKIDKLKAEIESIENSVPYCLKETLK